MGKLAGGVALVGVALFMVAGFLRADVDPLAPAALDAAGGAAESVFETIVEIVASIFG